VGHQRLLWSNKAHPKGCNYGGLGILLGERKIGIKGGRTGGEHIKFQEGIKGRRPPECAVKKKQKRTNGSENGKWVQKDRSKTFHGKEGGRRLLSQVGVQTNTKQGWKKIHGGKVSNLSAKEKRNYKEWESKILQGSSSLPEGGGGGGARNRAR